MDKLSIKVSIANRIYPMNVDAKEEEAVRDAVQLIEERTKEFEEKYAVRDKQDVLAMCLLQFVKELRDLRSKGSVDTHDLESSLANLESLLEQ
ncbi:cell division protein ZapA [Flavobacteriales bacterium]|jgi:cell division protein ZapA|nr:cell division protein ZapA [Flavobacteriales bacterium]